MGDTPDEFTDFDDRSEEQRAFDFEQAGFRVRRIQEQHGLAPSRRPFTSRKLCPDCNTTEAVIERRNGQDVVRCAMCDRALYNAPRTETGERRRSAKTVRAGIRPSQQSRILDRDHGRCILCGRAADDDVILHIGHLVSVEDGLDLGLTDAEINDDANLAAMCEACDSGFNRRSLSAATVARLLAAAVQAESRRGSEEVLGPLPGS